MTESNLKQPLISKSMVNDFPEMKKPDSDYRKQQYNPIKVPPDIQIAKRHGLATRTCKQRTEPITEFTDVCICCGLPIHNQLMSVMCPIKEFAHLGVVYCVYFQYIKMTFVLVTIHILLSGMAQLVLNNMGDMCFRLFNFSFICQGSVINILNIKDTTYIRVQNILNCFFIFVSFIVIQAFKLKQKLFQMKYSKKVWLVEDYSIVVNNFPHGTTLEEANAKVRKILDRSDLSQQQKAIIKVYFIFDIKAYVRLINKQAETMLQIGQCKYRYEKLKKKLVKDSKLDKHSTMKDIDEARKQINTLQDQIAQISDVIKQLQTKFYHEYDKVCKGTLNIKEQSFVFSGRCIFTLNSRKAKDYMLQNDTVNSSICYNPTDIIYANFGMPKVNIPKSKHIFYLIVALIGDFFILTLLKKFIKVEQSSGTLSQLNLFILSAASSIICCGFNTLFGIMIRHFARKNPNYQTKSDYFASVGHQLNITFMINMLATTYFSNTVSFWVISYGQSTFPHFSLNFLGLIYDVFFLFITNSYASSVMSYFDIVWGWRLYKRWKINKQLNVTQSQANSNFENHPFDIALRYVNVNKVVLISAAMAPLIPIGLQFTLLALIILYWIDKYLFVKRFTCKHKLSSTFSDDIIKQLQLYPLFMSFFNLLVMFIPVQESTNSQTKIQQFIYPNNQNTISFYIAIVMFLLSIWYNYSEKNLILSMLKRVFKSSLPEQIQIHQANYSELYLDNINKFHQDYSQYYPYFEISKDPNLITSGKFLNNMQKAVDDKRFQIKQ